MTDRKAFERVLELVNDEEIIEWANKKIEMLDKRAEKRAERKAEKSDEDTAALNAIIETMQALNKPATALEIVYSDDRLREVTTQKFTSLIKHLIADGSIAKNKIQGKMHYSLA